MCQTTKIMTDVDEQIKHEQLEILEIQAVKEKQELLQRVKIENSLS